MIDLSVFISKARKIKGNIRYFKKRWKPPFKKIEIQSSFDGEMQKAYCYLNSSSKPQPLIVSLHTWSTTYKKQDYTLSTHAVKNEWNYIFPDFRGANESPQSVGSEVSMADINDAIEYCISNGNVDLDNIFIVGGSGGAYTALCFYSSTKYKINSYITWSPITDLLAWHDQSIVRGTRYSQDIATATESVNSLNIEAAKRRSPLYRNFPNTISNLYLFSGYHDGANKGPVPLTHSLDFITNMH